jgi:hypothetical protein
MMEPQMIAIASMGALIVGAVAYKIYQAKQEEAARQAAQESSAMVKRRNWLEGVAGVVKGKTFHVGQRTVTMGRKHTNFIQVADSGASRVQCQLRGTERGLELIDVGSANGTFVNGAKVEANKPIALKDKDRIKIGDAELVYHRTADFTTNHGIIEVKARGAELESQTAMLGGAGWESTLRAELDKAGGDVDQAARNMKIQPEVLRQMMKQAGIGAAPSSMAAAVNIELERAQGDIEVVARKMGISVSALLDIMAEDD